MKNLLFLIVASLITLQTQSQNCKPAGNSKNKETGVKTPYYGGALATSLKGNKVEYRPSLYVFNDSADKINYIQTVLNISHLPQGVFNNGDNKWFDNGTTFELILENDERILFRSTQAKLDYKYKTTYTAFQLAPLSDNNLKKLTENKIKSFIIYPFLSTEIGSFEYDLKEKKSEKLLNQFNCFKAQGYENTGKVKNSRKAETYLKLADKYVKSGSYDKALEFYIKSNEEFPNAFSKANISIINIVLDNDRSTNLDKMKNHIDGVKRAGGSQENIKALESTLLTLIEAKPDIVELEEILLLIAE